MSEGSLGSLFTEGWGCDPTWVVVCPGAYQQVTDRWGQIFPKWPPPVRGRAAEYSGELSFQCPSRTMSHSHPLFSQEVLQELQSGPTQIPMEPLLCPGTQCMCKPVCAFQEWGLHLPQSPGVPVHKPHWPSMPDAPGALSPSARSPGVWI